MGQSPFNYYRKQVGDNIATISAKTGIARETLEKLERGESVQLSKTEVCALAYVLQTRAGNLCRLNIDAIKVDEPAENVPATKPKEVILSEEEQRKAIGKMVKEREKKLGLTVKQIKAQGVDPAWLYTFESGHPVAQERYKEQIAKLLGFDVSELEVKKP